MAFAFATAFLAVMVSSSLWSYWSSIAHSKRHSFVYAVHPPMKISTFRHFPLDIPIRFAAFDALAFVEFLLTARYRDANLDKAVLIVQ